MIVESVRRGENFQSFLYSCHRGCWPKAELLINGTAAQLYDMHNKLLVGRRRDGAHRLRNSGNQYCPVAPESQFADDDVVTAGPIVAKLFARSTSVCEPRLQFPPKALGRGAHTERGCLKKIAARTAPLGAVREAPGAAPRNRLQSIYASLPRERRDRAGIVYGRCAGGACMPSWVSQSRQRRQWTAGARPGRGITREGTNRFREGPVALLLRFSPPISIPAADELQAAERSTPRPQYGCAFSNSLESTRKLPAQRVRTPFHLCCGRPSCSAVRSMLGSRGSGQTGAGCSATGKIRAE